MCVCVLTVTCVYLGNGTVHDAEIRTTAVRKLLPESWGFMCPVHTPDGSPCGLLNHFTSACRVVTAGPDEPAKTEAALLQVKPKTLNLGGALMLCVHASLRGLL
jgi:DNA-directed RNA polymerase beta subunit